MRSSCRPRRTPQDKTIISPEQIVKLPAPALSRRTLLKVGGASAAALAAIGSLAWMPKRVVHAMPNTYPDIQFDIGNFIAPAETIAGIPVQFGPVNTYFAPAQLTRNPTKDDQLVLANALATIEANFPFSPSGIFVFVSYGLPYFNRLPADLVANNMPRLNSDTTRFVLEEAVASPTDVSPDNPQITKATFNVPVRIESNDVLFTLRSDSLDNITNVVNWLQGSNTLAGQAIASPAFNGLFNFTDARANFVQPGLPRQMADQLSAQNVAPFNAIATEINPASSMWMGFVDQQVDGSAPNGATVTFVGTSTAQLTTAVAGDYFDNGAIQHLSHVIDDLAQFYNTDPAKFTGAEPFSERVQYMFRSKQADGTPGLPFPEDPTDPFTNGGGQGAPTGDLATQQQSAFLDDPSFGATDFQNNFDPDLLATGVQQLRVGHEQALQRSSRAADGTPLHIRNDGPGLSALDVPDGSQQPTLEFTVFVPTAEFFRVMRINSASLDLVDPAEGGTGTSIPAGVNGSKAEDDGLERFLTVTRRQNFLIPPRRNRSFPLLELT